LIFHLEHSAAMRRRRDAMSEGYVIEDRDGEIAGIVVRQEKARGFRFFSSTRLFNAMDGHVFATPAAAQRAVGEFMKSRVARQSWRNGVPEVIP
jgi:hypothetical protein